METIDGVLHAPKECSNVPATYRLGGRLLVEDDESRGKYLSFRYRGDGVLDAFRRLKVPNITAPEFVNDLKRMICRIGSDGLGSYSAEWHNAIASVLTTSDFSDLQEDLKNLPIIPLQDGRWVSANEPGIYLPTLSENTHVPPGLGIGIVGEDASASEPRAQLFRSLGVSPYNPKSVCELILKYHTDDQWVNTSKSVDDWIQDGLYLFRHRNLLSTEDREAILFVPKSLGAIHTSLLRSQLARGSGLYVEHSCSLIRRYSDHPENIFPVLDPRYSQYVSQSSKDTGHDLPSDFSSWFVYGCQASSLPLLFDKQQPTPEWTFLATHCPVDLLRLLCDNQDRRYRVPINERQFQHTMRIMKVPCHGGQMQPLQETALATHSLLKMCPSLEFINLQANDMARFKFLSNFGVQTDVNIQSLQLELAAMSKRGQATNQERVHSIYRKLASYCGSEHGDNRIR